jgi:hypothetical protein
LFNGVDDRLGRSHFPGVLAKEQGVTVISLSERSRPDSIYGLGTTALYAPNPAKGRRLIFRLPEQIGQAVGGARTRFEVRRVPNNPLTWQFHFNDRAFSSLTAKLHLLSYNLRHSEGLPPFGMTETDFLYCPDEQSILCEVREPLAPVRPRRLKEPREYPAEEPLFRERAPADNLAQIEERFAVLPESQKRIVIQIREVETKYKVRMAHLPSGSWRFVPNEYPTRTRRL